MYKRIRLFVLTGIIFSLNIIPFAQRAAQAAGSVIISSPNQGATITGPVRISGTYTNAYSVAISFNAGQIYDVHMEDSDANESGTWYYDWTPAGFSGNVEIRVRATNIDDRYWTWAPVRTVNVSIATQQPPVVAIVSPGDGATASSITPIRNASKVACLNLTPCPKPSGSISLTTQQHTSRGNRRRKSFYSNFSKKVSQNH